MEPIAYISRAQADWHYIASGDIQGAGNNNFGNLTLGPGSGVGGDEIFTENTTGVPLTIPGGPIANIAFALGPLGIPFEHS